MPWVLLFSGWASIFPAAFRDAASGWSKFRGSQRALPKTGVFTAKNHSPVGTESLSTYSQAWGHVKVSDPTPPPHYPPWFEKKEKGEGKNGKE